jgi:hypothetical protein
MEPVEKIQNLVENRISHMDQLSDEERNKLRDLSKLNIVLMV